MKKHFLKLNNLYKFKKIEIQLQFMKMIKFIFIQHKQF